MEYDSDSALLYVRWTILNTFINPVGSSAENTLGIHTSEKINGLYCS